MRKVDREALKRAMEQASREPGRAEQLDSMLTERPWEEVAEFAACVCQSRSLRLRPWMRPPCLVDNGREYPPWNEAGQRLLKEMLALGVSRWHPDPLAAIEEKRRAEKNDRAALRNGHRAGPRLG